MQYFKKIKNGKTFILKAFRKPSATFLDQLTISAVQFFIGISFIYNGTPEQFGFFSFFMAIFYLCVSVQNATINTPLMVISPRLPDSIKIRFERGMFGALSIGIPFIIVFILLLTEAYLMLTSNNEIVFSQVFIFVICLISLMLREFWRADEYAKLQPVVALKRDFVYAVSSLSMIVLLSIFDMLNVRNAFVSMALSAFFVVLSPSLKICNPFLQMEEITSSIKRAWKISNWSLLGATSSWLQNQAFVYIPFFIIGVREVAFLSAARLIMMPPALLSGSWGNYFRPLASKKLSEGDQSGVMRLFFTSTVAIILILVAYTVSVLLFFRIAPDAWIPEDYKNIDSFVIFWAVIILIMTVRNNESSLFQASLAFKKLAIVGMLSALFTVIVTFILIITMETTGALVGRVAGELFLMIILMLGLKKIIYFEHK